MSQHAALARRHRDLHATDLDGLTAVLASQPDDDDLDRLADVFTLLGDRGRLRLLIGLLGREELCVSDLAVVSGLSESATSHALRLLRAHAVVGARRSGRRMHYSLRDDHVRTLLTTALDHVAHAHG